MKAVEMKRSKGPTEFQKILHNVEMSFFAGLKSASIYHPMADETIDKLLEEGFDVLVFRSRTYEIFLNEVLWSVAKEGRKGRKTEVITDTLEEVKEKREVLLKRFYRI